MQRLMTLGSSFYEMIDASMNRFTDSWNESLFTGVVALDTCKGVFR